MMSSEEALKVPSRQSLVAGYPSMSYLTTPLFSASQAAEVAECQLLNIYPTVPTIKQRASPYQGKSILCPKYTSCFPYYATMFGAYPLALPPQKSLKKLSSNNLDSPCLPALYYGDKPVCTCRCSLPAYPAPAVCSENIYKHASKNMQHSHTLNGPSPSAYFPGLYHWYLPNRRFASDDLAPSLANARLSTLRAHASTALLPRNNEVGVKRPQAKRFQCTHCEKSFGKSSHLRDHIRTHTGDRPYRCQYCEKAFTQYSNLRTHTRIHTGEKPYRCRHCNKSFTQAVTLRSHTRTHTGDSKPYHCKQCAKSFSCFSGLKAHLRVHEMSDSDHETGKLLATHNMPLTPSIKQEKTTDDDAADADQRMSSTSNSLKE